MSDSQLTLNLGEGSVSFRFTPEAARELKEALDDLMQRLKAIAAFAAPGAGGGRPQPQQPMEYRHTGEVFLEIFCNPNIYPTPFSAKVLITLRDDRIRISTEAELTRIREDIHEYLERVG
ncbi:hypothetical protein [Phormidium sp. CCY1219]|jgi:hypothetical protein|uniref:hypothetical protein n=1 Tax=Phormidium sp. CCY1219 TaxID=2886104 RepID=UPI002D1F76F2|nr:hypothetical protein [Phormidium sp. CCY1219]MEB3830734.1 hypothetical protein [Phormidium sp. CCY1219]